MKNFKNRLPFYMLIIFLAVSSGSCRKNMRNKYSLPAAEARRILLMGNKKQWNHFSVKYNITYTRNISRQYLLKHGSPPDPTEKEIEKGWFRVTRCFQLKKIKLIDERKEKNNFYVKLKLFYKDGENRTRTFIMRPITKNEWRIMIPVPSPEV